jgi:hypothetical protein
MEKSAQQIGTKVKIPLNQTQKNQKIGFTNTVIKNYLGADPAPFFKNPLNFDNHEAPFVLEGKYYPGLHIPKEMRHVSKGASVSYLGRGRLLN